ncbi:alpha/beta hydrolase [Aestuariibaculum sp. M13]|uniref:alpha/beta fold hydrolase n=1 Tax=Aestuariibaculum sp. M13 TaxID=2967132 RepID=UPI00215A048F|nr:alpha/beta hydrolase [Aestuariibaculum sp. M13]MCR8666202.1 alpha/beta hydrolase [Aestuariibaculum sp. M13]
MRYQTKFQIILLLLTLKFCFINAQNNFDIPYGSNESAGKFVKINGAKIYYEEYGKGEPLLLIHGCGADIKSMEYQIDYFKSKYRVIVADSRGQGKSELKTDSLTYSQITKDWEGLVRHLKLDSINILGWSDGGIIGLKMGISRKTRIKKIVAMGANLKPDTTAVNSWAPEKVRRDQAQAKEMLAKGDTSQDWNLEIQLDGLLLNQPNISHSDLKKITASVLIMVGDRDIIKNEHAVEIFNNLPKGQLCIMPGINHGAPRNNPIIFNEIANRFLTEQFDYTQRK